MSTKNDSTHDEAHADHPEPDGMSYSSSDGEAEINELNEFYFAARDPKSKQVHVPIVPGQTKKYTLPAGADMCPIVGCPAWHSGREFKPKWRLNEHMKTRHGWPRLSKSQGSSEQHSNDGPRSSIYSTRSSRSSQGRRESAVSNGSFSANSPKCKRADAHHRNDSSVLSEAAIDPSPARPTRSRRQTAKGIEMANSMAKLDEATSSRSKRARVSQHLDDTQSDDDGDTTDNTEDPTRKDRRDASDVPMDIDSRSPPRKSIPKEETRDYELIAAIKSLVSELRLASAKNPELATAAKDYQKLIDKDLVRVNCKLSEKDAVTLASCYKHLAERHNARAMVYTMRPSQPVELPLGRPAVGPHQHQPGVPNGPPGGPPHGPSTGPQHGPSTVPPPGPSAVPPPGLSPGPSNRLPSGPLAPKQPTPPRSFTFINDAPKITQPPPKHNGFTPVNAQHVQSHQTPMSAHASASVPAPGAVEAQKPLTLKLKLTPGKEKEPPSA